jgi:signal transduction histidine kinase
MEAGTRNRRPLAPFALGAEMDSRAGHSDPGRSAIVLAIDASEPPAGYGGWTMRIAGRLQRHAFDAAVVALALVAQIEVWAGPVLAPRGVLAAIVVLWTLALLLRRRFPFAAPVFIFFLYATVSLADREALSSLDTGAFMLLLAFWAVGAQAEARQAAAGVAIGCAAVAVVIERDLRIDPSEGIEVVIAGAGLALAALVLERRARRAALLEERAVRFEREREERERLAVADERRRIARDLHDVVAHGVGVMTVQAGAARLLLDDEPARAREALRAVEQAGT